MFKTICGSHQPDADTNRVSLRVGVKRERKAIERSVREQCLQSSIAFAIIARFLIFLFLFRNRGSRMLYRYIHSAFFVLLCVWFCILGESALAFQQNVKQKPVTAKAVLFIDAPGDFNDPPPSANGDLTEQLNFASSIGSVALMPSLLERLAIRVRPLLSASPKNHTSELKACLTTDLNRSERKILVLRCHHPDAAKSVAILQVWMDVLQKHLDDRWKNGAGNVQAQSETIEKAKAEVQRITQKYIQFQRKQTGLESDQQAALREIERKQKELLIFAKGFRKSVKEKTITLSQLEQAELFLSKFKTVSRTSQKLQVNDSTVTEPKKIENRHKRDQLYQLKLEREELTATYALGHPKLRAVEQRIKQLEKSLNASPAKSTTRKKTKTKSPSSQSELSQNVMQVKGMLKAKLDSFEQTTKELRGELAVRRRLESELEVAKSRFYEAVNKLKNAQLQNPIKLKTLSFPKSTRQLTRKELDNYNVLQKLHPKLPQLNVRRK